MQICIDFLMRNVLPAVALAVALLTPALAQTGRQTGAGVNFYSLEKEIALGRQLAEEIERHATVLDEPFLAGYVHRLGQYLLLSSEARVPLTIKILAAEEPDVLALPGGFLFVNSGLILLAGSESELAGAIAHGVAHVAARHGTRQATRGQIINVGTIPLIYMGGWSGYGIRQAAGLAIPLGFLKFARAFEREADSLGLQYLYKAGYDPNAYVRLLEAFARLEAGRPATTSKAFLAFPPTTERIAAAQKEIQESLPSRADRVTNTLEFEAAKAWLAGAFGRR